MSELEKVNDENQPTSQASWNVLPFLSVVALILSVKRRWRSLGRSA